MHCPPHARSVRPALDLGGIRVDFPRALERLELAPEPAVLRGAIDRVVPGEMINMSTPYHRAELPGNAAQRQPASIVAASVVMPGLGPGIHPPYKNDGERLLLMDCRVKPGNDAVSR
jgi:hypothetical protein